MKRLLPFDPSGPASRPVTAPGVAPFDQDVSSPELRAQQCAIPVDPDPRRTALFAIVATCDGDMLLVYEAPIEITSLKGTDLVHVAFKPSALPDSQIAVTVSERTCFDLEQPATRPAPGTPVIVIGLEVGDTVEAEIIAGTDVEARYRSTVLKYQGTRAWHRPMSMTEQSCGN